MPMLHAACTKKSEARTHMQTTESASEQNVAPQAAMDLGQALETLKVVRDAFAELNVKFTLAAGTLLGAVREGRFMGWDYDTDLSCSDDSDGSKIPALAQLLSSKGVSVYYSEALRCVAVYHKGVTIDIDFWRKDANDLTMPLRFALNKVGKLIYFLEWVLLHTPSASIRQDKGNGIKFAEVRNVLCSIASYMPFFLRKQAAQLLRKLARLTGNPRGLVRVPAHYFRTYGTIKFCGMEFSTPINVEGYLAHRYGAEWRTPQPGWVYYDKAGTIFSPSQIPEGNWLFKRFEVQ